MPNKAMAASLTGPVAVPLAVTGYCLRLVNAVDLGSLASAYFDSTPASQTWASATEAQADLEAAIDGAFGALLPQACLTYIYSCRVAAAILTVHRAPWPDTPDGPFIIDLFTIPAHRRLGLARNLVLRSMAQAQASGESAIGLRVNLDNTNAEGLYRSVGFRDWPAPDA